MPPIGIVKPISLLRFNALAGFSRNFRAMYDSVEKEWWSDEREIVLGLVIQDRVDKDYLGILMGRDMKRRFRCVRVLDSVDSIEESRTVMLTEMDRLSQSGREVFDQEDEIGRLVDFFKPVVSSERFHPTFKILVEDPRYAPAKEMIEAMMHYFEDVDGNFVEQFQTTSFDTRLWELYLFGTFTELGFQIDRSYPAPDFRCMFFDFEFLVEATTVNPTEVDGVEVVPKLPTTPEETKKYINEYMPIKYGSALYSKLRREYWKLQHVQGKPLVFAIQDFHRTGSMTWTHSALNIYLFGVEAKWEHDEQGNLQIDLTVKEFHRFGSKEIPSGFFSQEGAEHISAVLVNPSGTITKFARLGYIADFGPRDITMIREGLAYKHDDNSTEPEQFTKIVTDPGYEESWVEGVSMFHNPRALNPLPMEIFPGAAHHHLKDGRFVSYIPDFHPMGSVTQILK